MKEFTGPYKWYVNAAMPQDGTHDYNSWRIHTQDEIYRVVKETGIEKGQKVKVLVNGGAKPLWYTGEVNLIAKGNLLDNSLIQLQQNKTLKYIDSWKVEKIQLLEE